MIITTPKKRESTQLPKRTKTKAKIKEFFNQTFQVNVNKEKTITKARGNEIVTEQATDVHRISSAQVIDEIRYNMSVRLR